MIGQLDITDDEACVSSLILTTLGLRSLRPGQKELLQQALNPESPRDAYMKIQGDDDWQTVTIDGKDYKGHEYWHEQFNQASNKLSEIETYNNKEITRLERANAELVQIIKEMQAAQEETNKPDDRQPDDRQPDDSRPDDRQPDDSRDDITPRIAKQNKRGKGSSKKQPSTSTDIRTGDEGANETDG